MTQERVLTQDERLVAVRRRLESRERELSPFASRSFESRGRERAEEPSLVRTEYQRDRDRIIHCKAFRRLKHKTQVFVAPMGDHFVTRLTHTLETSQVARTIARALNLNEDLTEAIGLGHDLGHTPFGHAGERALGELLPEGFRHNEQSLRVVEKLENGGQGLNLTWEVREGIVKHSKAREDILAEGWGTASTLEGQIVKIADSVAYLNHDIADAIRAGLLGEDDLPRSARELLGTNHAQRINALVLDIVETSWAAVGGGEHVESEPPRIAMSNAVAAATNELRDFMFANVYEWEGQRAEAARARRVVEFLFEHYLAHPEAITTDFTRSDDPLARRVADYIAGMTDLFALRRAEELGLVR
ncbi:MAG: deoxyguanosinetriphosphate triphosphohydrolase [Dehalococcoidia bacterium]